MTKTINQTGFISIATTIVFVVLLLTVAIFYILGNDDPNSGIPSPHQKNQTISPYPSDPQTSNSKTFDPQAFYDKIQTGMDLTTLNQLAGKDADCTITDVYPAPSSYPCYWSDSKYIVAVTLGGHGVTGKAIHPNKTEPTN